MAIDSAENAASPPRTPLVTPKSRQPHPHQVMPRPCDAVFRVPYHAFCTGQRAAHCSCSSFFFSPSSRAHFPPQAKLGVLQASLLTKLLQAAAR